MENADFKKSFLTTEELAQYKILIPADAGECNRYAAENLQCYVNKTCGINLAILQDDELVTCPFFSIGNTRPFQDSTGNSDRSVLVHDGFRIFMTDSNVIYFDSLSHRGVMYAVFDFIEKELGVRFLTSRVEHIPTVKEIDLSGINRVSIPSFEMGTENFSEVFGQGGPASAVDMDFYCKIRARDLFTPIEEKYGGPLPYYARNSFHNFHYYCPPVKYVNKHPEWYRFLSINNVITPTIDLTNGITEDGKLDESMEESVAKVVIEEFKKDIDAHPDAEIFGFTQEDSSLDVDNEKNRLWVEKYGRSGILIRFCNVVIRELNRYTQEKYGKTIKLSTFAYCQNRYAPIKEVNGERVPVDETCICDENLIIQFALFGNSYYSYLDDRQRPEIRQIISDWQKIGKRFWFWAYDMDFAHFHYFIDSFHTINDNMRGFKDLGIEYLFMECGGGSGNWQTQMRGYVYLKKIWNVELDANDLLNEYIDLYYNIVGDKVREFIALFHDNYRSINEAGEREVVFGIRASCEDVENNPIEMLLRALVITDEMQEIVMNADMSDELRKDMLRRVAEVRMTPLKMIYNKFYDYFPHEFKEHRLALREELIKTARLVDVPDKFLLSGAAWRLFDQYIPEMDERHGNYEDGKEANEAHQAGYVPDDV